MKAPHSLVTNLQANLKPNSLVTDIGSNVSDTGLYLAQEGHTTVSIDILEKPLIEGSRRSARLGNLASRAFFIQGSATDLMFGDEQFDAVISTITLQEIPRALLPKAMGEIRRITKPGGLNALRVYAGTVDEIDKKPNHSIFEFGALELIYKSKSWKTISYKEKHNPVHTDGQGKTWVSSFSEIIAIKPNETDVDRQLLLAKAEYYRRSDPELYDYFIQEANIR